MPKNNSKKRRDKRKFDAEIRQEERNERSDSEHLALLIDRVGIDGANKEHAKYNQDGASGQDRESYTDDQDRESYVPDISARRRQRRRRKHDEKELGEEIVEAFQEPQK